MESLIVAFVQFSCVIAFFFFFLKGDWIFGYACAQRWGFPKISLFHKILTQVVQQLMRQLVHLTSGNA